MRPQDVEKLQLHRDIICSDISFESVAPALIAVGLLSRDDFQQIQAKDTDVQRMNLVLKILPKKGPKALRKFVKVLQKNYLWIAEQISGTKISTTNNADLNLNRASTSADLNDYSSSSSSHCSSVADNEDGEDLNDCCPRITKEQNQQQSSQTIRGNAIKASTSGLQYRGINPSPVSDEDTTGISTSISNHSHNQSNNRSFETCNTSATQSLIVSRRTPDNQLPPVEQLNQKLSTDMLDVVGKNYRVTQHWTTLAHALNLDNQIAPIRIKILVFGEDLKLSVTYLLKEWMSQYPQSANLGNLLKALRQHNFNDVADELEEKFAA